LKSKDYLTNKNFCPIPWTGLMYNFDGSIKNCIRSAGPIGNICNNPIEDIVNDKPNITTKLNMISNRPGERCSPCYDLEKGKNSFDIISDRVYYLKELKKISLDTYNNETNFNLQVVDIRWSNLCNFACVYCGPDFSSRWEQERSLSITTPNQKQQIEFTNYVMSKASNLKHVYLAGGEPLLMKQNLDLLDKLSSDVNLRINTNLSKTNTQIFDKICTFKNVHWIVSVESIEEEYEYIRYGGSWKEFLENLNIIKNLGHKISFNMLHFSLNYLSIFRCVDFFVNMGFHYNSFIIGPLLNPMSLNIRHLPQDMLHLTQLELQRRISSKPGFLYENGLQNILDYLKTPFDKDLTQVFDYLQVLDQRRNLDSTKIFKELYNYGN